MTVASHTPPTDQLGELHRQAEVLVEKGYPALAGMTEDEFRTLTAALEPSVPYEPFVLVVTGAIVPIDRLIERVALRGKSGFTTMDAGDIVHGDGRGGAAECTRLPDHGRGYRAGSLNVRPDDAFPDILAAGRTPLTLDEGLAVVTQHPQWLRERNCFEMLDSRAGDKRVTGIWVSKGAPRLGWCWGGNPHTWLGMASAGRRLG